MGAVALVMFACAMALLLLGYPVAFTLGAVAMVFGGALLGDRLLCEKGRN